LRGDCKPGPLIIAAPFSAIMIAGALVLVEVTAGMTEASVTLRLAIPCTRHPLWTTVIACAHIAGAEARGLVEFADLASLKAGQPEDPAATTSR
jgi:hypothetical protein